MLERLPFTIPEFTRVIWVSESARDYWQPKIQAVSRGWSSVECATVLHGLRRGVLQSVTPESLPDVQRWCLFNSVPMVVVGMEGASESYGNATLPYQPGRSFMYRVYMGADPAEFFDAWSRGDNDAIGAALGFPDCCVKFFDQFWRVDGWRDLTYPAMRGEMFTRPYANLLLKHLGVRPVFHLPCTFTCEPSLLLGERLFDLRKELGYQKEADWAHTLLSMPMEWSSLHGVAMVVTPIFKLVYASDPLPEKVTLRLLSAEYPEHSASGNVFPFSTSVPIRVVPKRYLNGFTTLDAMRRGHQFILDALPPDLTGRVLDLGCGDGTLLRAIQTRQPNIVPQGIESRTDLPPVEYIDIQDLFAAWSWDRDFRLVLIAVQRLVEVGNIGAAGLLTEIARHSQQLLVYSYDGWPDGADALLVAKFSLVWRKRDAPFECCLLEEPV